MSLASRANGLPLRTLELFDQRGNIGRYLVEGQKAQAVSFTSVRLNRSAFPTRHPFSLDLGSGTLSGFSPLGR